MAKHSHRTGSDYQSVKIFPGSFSSNPQSQTGRFLDGFLDFYQEGYRFFSVNHPVIVGKRKIHHRADNDLSIPDHGPLLNRMHSPKSHFAVDWGWGWKA